MIYLCEMKMLRYSDIKIILFHSDDSRGPLDDYVLTPFEADILQTLNVLHSDLQSYRGAIKIHLEWEVDERMKIENNYSLN